MFFLDKVKRTDFIKYLFTYVMLNQSKITAWLCNKIVLNGSLMNLLHSHYRTEIKRDNKRHSLYSDFIFIKLQQIIN